MSETNDEATAPEPDDIVSQALADVDDAERESLRAAVDTWKGKATRLARRVIELNEALNQDGDERRRHLSDLLTQTVAERDRAQAMLDDATAPHLRAAEGELMEPLRALLPDSFEPVLADLPEADDVFDIAYHGPSGIEFEGDYDDGFELDDGTRRRIVGWKLKPGVTVAQLVGVCVQRVKEAERTATEDRTAHAHLMVEYDRSLGERNRWKAEVEEARDFRAEAGKHVASVERELEKLRQERPPVVLWQGDGDDLNTDTEFSVARHAGYTGPVVVMPAPWMNELHEQAEALTAERSKTASLGHQLKPFAGITVQGPFEVTSKAPNGRGGWVLVLNTPMGSVPVRPPTMADIPDNAYQPALGEKVNVVTLPGGHRVVTPYVVPGEG